MDPDRPLRLRAIVLTTAAFTVLAVLVAIRQMSEARAGLGVGLMIVAGGVVLGVLTGEGLYRVMGSASKGLVETLFSAKGLPPAPSFSLQEAMIVQGRHREAADSFREHLAVNPGDHDARLALGALLAGPLSDHAAAEQLFRTVRDGRPTERQEATARQGLIDLYAITGQTGRQITELARFADRYPGTPAARAAREAIQTLKASSLDA
ncbi:MAG TPA: tetratricopeptide repeat protein [Gemmatimonadales bacterium]